MKFHSGLFFTHVSYLGKISVFCLDKMGHYSGMQSRVVQWNDVTFSNCCFGIWICLELE